MLLVWETRTPFIGAGGYGGRQSMVVTLNSMVMMILTVAVIASTAAATVDNINQTMITLESNNGYVMFHHPPWYHHHHQALESSQSPVDDDDSGQFSTAATDETIQKYGGYLARGAYHHRKCARRRRDKPIIHYQDIRQAMEESAAQVDDYRDWLTGDDENDPGDAILYQYATQRLKRKRCLAKMDVVMALPLMDTDGAACRHRRRRETRCEPKARFRSIDGSCNNLKRPEWGRSFSCHRRLLPPDYGDGVAEPRRAWNGGQLPNARSVSLKLLPERDDVPDRRLTAMAMAFGQFIIHDIARTLPVGGNEIPCCQPGSEDRHPECFPIEILAADDPFRVRYNQTCINFVRTVPCNRCALGAREQLNQATHTFDMSHMYGLRTNESLALRTRRGGKLRSSYTSTQPPEELPPKTDQRGCNIRPEPPRFKCFETADGIRASQHPALQSLHTAFHRRHNQHAERLAELNPHWGDEKLYQEARRITVAEECAIIYGQYLPAIFGRRLMKHFRLGLHKYGYSQYDAKLDPSTLQEFIVAGGRFGHSQVNDQFSVLFGASGSGGGGGGSHEEQQTPDAYAFRLRDNFFETTIVSLGHSGGILQGLITDRGQATDPYFSGDIKNSLYRLRGDRIGRDLPAFNIQRGREHGIPGYVYYLDFCFGHKVARWNDLVTFIPRRQLNRIRHVYDDFRDVDLFVGGISERPVTGAAFGPTFACINGIQFYNLKYGDRFFFEHRYQSGSFTPAQLANIKKVASLSALICKTHGEVDHMPTNPFRETVPHRNPLKPCFTFPELDYSLWADNKSGEQDSPDVPVYRPKYSMMAPRHQSWTMPAISYHFQYAKSPPLPPELMMATGTMMNEENKMMQSAPPPEVLPWMAATHLV